MAADSAPRVPAARSLVMFQEHLARGLWADRHLQALASDPTAVGPFMSIFECTRDFQQQQQRAVAANDSAKLRQAATRNRVCLCAAVCPQETTEWLQCARAAARALRAAKKGGGASSSTATTHFAPCEAQRRRLEACTQWESTRLLHAAVLPKDGTPDGPIWSVS